MHAALKTAAQCHACSIAYQLWHWTSAMHCSVPHMSPGAVLHGCGCNTCIVMFAIQVKNKESWSRHAAPVEQLLQPGGQLLPLQLLRQLQPA